MPAWLRGETEEEKLVEESESGVAKQETDSRSAAEKSKQKHKLSLRHAAAAEDADAAMFAMDMEEGEGEGEVKGTPPSASDIFTPDGSASAATGGRSAFSASNTFGRLSHESGGEGKAAAAPGSPAPSSFQYSYGRSSLSSLLQSPSMSSLSNVAQGNRNGSKMPIGFSLSQDDALRNQRAIAWRSTIPDFAFVNMSTALGGSSLQQVVWLRQGHAWVRETSARLVKKIEEQEKSGIDGYVSRNLQSLVQLRNEIEKLLVEENGGDSISGEQVNQVFLKLKALLTEEEEAVEGHVVGISAFELLSR